MLPAIHFTRLDGVAMKNSPLPSFYLNLVEPELKSSAYSGCLTKSHAATLVLCKKNRQCVKPLIYKGNSIFDLCEYRKSTVSVMYIRHKYS